jgi:CTP:molybdopterin cytidylyltransferase MocA
VAFSRAAAQALALLSGDQGAASIVRNAAENQRLQRWDCDDIGCVLDVDTVQALRKRAGSGRTQFLIVKSPEGGPDSITFEFAELV